MKCIIICCMLPWPVCLFKLILHLLCTINIQRRDIYLDDLVNRTVNSDLRSNALTRFLWNLVRWWAPLNSFISVWMTLTIIQCHRVTRMWEIQQSFCGEVAWSSPNICDDWLYYTDDSKESCEYGSFEHLPFKYNLFWLPHVMCDNVLHWLPNIVLWTRAKWSLHGNVQ